MVTGATGRGWAGVTQIASAAAVLVGIAGCDGLATPPQHRDPVTLRIGFGLAAGSSSDFGIAQTESNIASDELVSVPRSGRTLPSLAEGWRTSPDGLTLRVRLRPSVTFENGNPVNAQAVSALLRADLPGVLGPAFDDIAQIRPASDLEVEFTFHHRSTLVLEALDFVSIVDPTSRQSGTGPFFVHARHNGEVEMLANPRYYAGKPAIDQVTLKPYASVRSAWADLLRGQVDMLYEVGVDALDSLESSTDVNIFTFQRSYAYLLLLNLRRPELGDPGFRRGLNAAIDRRALIADALRGHGEPAAGPLSTRHWAYSADLPPFQYQPRSKPVLRSPRALTVLFGEPSLERLAVAIQRQLQAAGIEIKLELVPADEWKTRLRAGNFDAALSDFNQGPNLVWPYLYWHSNGPYNFGGYHNLAVDDALDRVRGAVNDDGYKAGVAAFWRAIVDDPPAVFLAWPERARAVSTRFTVPVDPDRDVLTTIHLWKPDFLETLPNAHR